MIPVQVTARLTLGQFARAGVDAPIRMQQDAIYAYGWFKPPATPLPEGATAVERLIHLTGR